MSQEGLGAGSSRDGNANIERPSEPMPIPLEAIMPKELLDKLPTEAREALAQADAIMIEMVSNRDIGAEMKASFDALDELDSAHPRIEALRKYGSELTEVLAFLRGPMGMSVSKARGLVENMNAEEVSRCFSNVIDRLREETSYLHELEDVGIAEALTLGLENGKYSARVRFYPPDSSKAKRKKRQGIGGEYSGITNKASVYTAPPEKAQMLTQLATSGLLPTSVATLDHELVHATQTTHLQRFAFWGGHAVHFGTLLGLNTVSPYLGLGYAVGTIPLMKKIYRHQPEVGILREAHAYEAMTSSPSHPEPIIEQNIAIMSGALSHIPEELIGHYAPVAARAYDLVHGLRLVGLNDQEIGNIVSGAKWSKERQTFPKLEERLDLEMEAMGCVEFTDKRAVMQALHTRFELELARQRRLACNIAGDELGSATNMPTDST